MVSIIPGSGKNLSISTGVQNSTVMPSQSSHSPILMDLKVEIARMDSTLEKVVERGRKKRREEDDIKDDDDDEEGTHNGGQRKRKRSRKALDKKFPCPEEACGKSYSRAEHLYRHQLNREFTKPSFPLV